MAVPVTTRLLAAGLASRLVTIGRHVDPEQFVAGVRGQLAGLGVAAELGLVPSSDPGRSDKPARRIIRIKGRRLVGYAVRVTGLTAEEALTIQEQGLGSHRRMGCGVFLPLSEGGRR